jgi:hypothetical protein
MATNYYDMKNFTAPTAFQGWTEFWKSVQAQAKAAGQTPQLGQANQYWVQKVIPLRGKTPTDNTGTPPPTPPPTPPTPPAPPGPITPYTPGAGAPSGNPPPIFWSPAPQSANEYLTAIQSNYPEWYSYFSANPTELNGFWGSTTQSQGPGTPPNVNEPKPDAPPVTPPVQQTTPSETQSDSGGAGATSNPAGANPSADNFSAMFNQFMALLQQTQGQNQNPWNNYFMQGNPFQSSPMNWQPSFGPSNYWDYNQNRNYWDTSQQTPGVNQSSQLGPSYSEILPGGAGVSTMDVVPPNRQTYTYNPGGYSTYQGSVNPYTSNQAYNPGGYSYAQGQNPWSNYLGSQQQNPYNQNQNWYQSLGY